MGIYSIQGINESSVSSYLNDIQIEDIVEENYMEAALRHTYEINENMHNVMKAIGISELAVYEETGQEVEYVSESVSGIFNKIKEMLKKVWEKIASLFKKFLAKMQSYGNDDAAFVKKYRQQIVTGSTKDLKIKGYKFTLDAVDMSKISKDDGVGIDAIKGALGRVDSSFTSNIGINDNGGVTIANKTTYSEADASAIDEAIKKFNSIDTNDVIEDLRAHVLNKNSGLNQKEFNQELFEMLRGNESSKSELDDKDIDPTGMCNFLLGSSKEKKSIHDDFKDLNTALKHDIKTVENWNKNYSKYDKDAGDEAAKFNSKAAQVLTKVGNLLVQGKTMCEQIEAAKMNAFNEKRKQYKATCVKLIGRKEKNESAGFYDDDLSYTNESAVNSFLNNVKLI